MLINPRSGSLPLVINDNIACIEEYTLPDINTDMRTINVAIIVEKASFES
ncbi:MAG: hypothetical protein IPK25_15890 [Saprospiraceae bacterium]|nr:hypothetical protein [Saprospiraceae bacterium]